MTPEMQRRFIENLRIVRNAHGITAEDLSMRCVFKTKRRVSDIEGMRGSLKLEELIVICNVLGVPIDEMLYKKVTISFS
jgi:transcriptional regulator with XRE-family HTH domain